MITFTLCLLALIVGYFTYGRLMERVWAITVYLVLAKKPYWITFIPALFMTCVCVTYICIAPEGLGLSQDISYYIGVGCVIAAIIWFYIWMGNNKKTGKLSE